MLSCIESECSKRNNFEGYTTIEDLFAKIDAEIQLLQPLHIRRIILIKITSSKMEKSSTLLRRLIEAAKVADLPNLSPEALILHLFLDKSVEKDENREIKNRAIEILRTKSNSGAKVEQSDIDEFKNCAKEQESSLFSRLGKPSKAMRADQN